MKSFWIVLLVASSAVFARAQLADDYDNYFNYDEDDIDDFGKALDEEINESLNKKTDLENDLKVEEEIQQFREADGEKNENIEEPKESIDKLENYQFEDNRDKPNEDKNLPENNNDEIGNSEQENIENRPEPDDPNAPSRNEDYALLWGDDNLAPLPVPEISEDEKEEENKAIIEETKQILAEQDADDFEKEIKEVIEKTGLKPEEEPNLQQIVEETKQLLAEESDNLNEDETNIENTKFDEKDNISPENVENKENQDGEDDTVDNVYKDLNADLDKLFATLDKLKGDMSNNEDGDAPDFSKALEDADKLFENLDNMDGSDENGNDKYEDVDLDKLLENILSENDMKAEDSAAEILETLADDELNEPNPDDANEQDIESLDKLLKPIEYIKDALVAEPKENAETLETSAENNANEDVKDASIEKKAESNNEGVASNEHKEANTQVNDENVEEEPIEISVQTALVDELNSAELQDLVNQFALLHKEDLDMHSESFNKNVAPVHITLKLDEPTVITSPNYPMAYPTNNIVDWILEGPGEGIEMNITEFAVNGALGDYLLIKPGDVEDTSTEGILLTYRLTSERRFRFTGADRLFLRFESKPGMMFFRGFSLQAKMISPLPSEPEPVPEPEAVVTAPHSTATVTLAMTVPDFKKVEDDFRQILADMAEQFIHENDVEPGLNTTSEVTQITRVDLCPMTWPGFEGCTAVSFGVSLAYEEEELDPRLDEDDLRTMWTTYVNRDPFALRLRTMGIDEFSGPSSAAMTAWLLIAGGVVVSMAMLAFVMWRYSCFEGYTRMKTFSDTESLHNEKRNLDLYPTPHQTLPPLYADSQPEYKWAEDDTRVDMGGFANRSYTRENMYDFESDDDVIPTRDRQAAAATKDYSNV